MTYSLLLTGIAVAFFVLMVAAIQFGRYLGRQRGPDPRGGRAGAGAIEAIVFALLGLLIAFTFSGAAQRLADRRGLVVQEVNAIGTAWLRIDLLNPADQGRMREEFRNYVDARIDFYRHLTETAARQPIAVRAALLQNEIWSTAVSARAHIEPPYAVSFISAVNDMLDASTNLTVAQSVHPPLAIFIFLGVLALLCACLVGMDLAQDSSSGLFHQLVYALVVTAALYVVIDFEFPRVGIIRIDPIDTLLVSTRETMGPPGAAGR